VLGVLGMGMEMEWRRSDQPCHVPCGFGGTEKGNEKEHIRTREYAPVKKEGKAKIDNQLGGGSQGTSTALSLTRWGGNGKIYAGNGPKHPNKGVMGLGGSRGEGEGGRNKQRGVKARGEELGKGKGEVWGVCRGLVGPMMPL